MATPLQKRQAEANRIRTIRENEDRIAKLEGEIASHNLQISREEKIIVDLAASGKLVDKKTALDHARKLKIMRSDRDRLLDSETMLRSGLSGLKGAVIMVDTQNSLREMVGEKMNLVSTLDIVDVEDLNIESRAADEGLNDIMSFAGISDSSRQEDQEANQSIIDDLMRESGKADPSPIAERRVVKNNTNAPVKRKDYSQISQFLQL